MAINNFLFNSDYPIDKIIGYQTGSLTGTSVSANPSHGFSFDPLPYVQWSLNANFDTADDTEGAFVLGYQTFSGINVGLGTINLSALSSDGVSRTYYYRIFYTMPPDIDADVPIINMDDFKFNTDYNYPKIYREGVINSSTGTVDHNLGYYPQVEVWYQWNIIGGSRISRLKIGDDDAPGFITGACFVNTTNISLVDDSLGVTKWYYRIYADAV